MMMKYFLATAMLFGAAQTFAADHNGYTAQYERNIGAPPACDVFINSSSDPDWAKINDSSARVICFEPGDYSAKGVITLTANGANGRERWLRYFNRSDNGTHPVKQNASDRAVIGGLKFNGGDYWIIHRLTISGRGQSYSPVDFPETNSDNNVLDSVLAENARYNIVTIFPSNDYNTIQNSVLRRCLATPDQDWSGIGLFGGPTNTRVVNNEVYECTKGFYISEHAAPGTIVENNDMYIAKSQYTDCRGNYTTTGICAAAEIVIGMKAGGSRDNPIRIIQNRLWGARVSDQSNICCGSGTGGDVVHFSNALSNPATGTRYVLFQNNVVMDAQNGIGDWWDYTSNNSIVGNIIYDIRKMHPSHAGHALSSNFLSNTEYYLNTIIDAHTWFEFGGGRNSEVRCNVVINSGVRTGGPASGMQVDGNAFYNTPFFTTGSATNNINHVTVAAARHTEYCFKRRLLTGPEDVCIPNARPTTASPHYQACSSATGTRAELGINNDTLLP